MRESVGWLRLPKPFEALLAQAGFDPLEIELDHMRAVARLPFDHRDPFDHILVTQGAKASC